MKTQTKKHKPGNPKPSKNKMVKEKVWKKPPPKESTTD
ncbi:uncharacterized protein METZ01_LOCUS64336 [marine metagenome]|uniref:Uncharacterized protein n=1 Tax=marine metagenome TaxID=408172 RepID=A0A381T5N4_9ZZZZ